MDSALDEQLARNIELSLRLQEACAAEDLEQVKSRINDGGAAWFQDSDGWSALHFAACALSLSSVVTAHAQAECASFPSSAKSRDCEISAAQRCRVEPWWVVAAPSWTLS